MRNQHLLHTQREPARSCGQRFHQPRSQALSSSGQESLGTRLRFRRLWVYPLWCTSLLQTLRWWRERTITRRWKANRVGLERERRGVVVKSSSSPIRPTLDPVSPGSIFFSFSAWRTWQTPKLAYWLVEAGSRTKHLQLLWLARGSLYHMSPCVSHVPLYDVTRLCVPINSMPVSQFESKDGKQQCNRGLCL